MFTGPVGPIEIFFYWPEAVLENFYWSGASSSLIASSPDFSSVGLWALGGESRVSFKFIAIIYSHLSLSKTTYLKLSLFLLSHLL